MFRHLVHGAATSLLLLIECNFRGFNGFVCQNIFRLLFFGLFKA